jgi:hypothetical protein
MHISICVVHCRQVTFSRIAAHERQRVCCLHHCMQLLMHEYVSMYACDELYWSLYKPWARDLRLIHIHTKSSAFCMSLGILNHNEYIVYCSLVTALFCLLTLRVRLLLCIPKAIGTRHVGSRVRFESTTGHHTRRQKKTSKQWQTHRTGSKEWWC